MREEIFADVYYRLNIQTYLFAILVDHIDEEKVEFSLKDFENKRISFINCGIRQVGNCFTKDELIEYLNNHPYIKRKNGNNTWVAEMKAFIGDVSTLTKDELEFVNFDETLAKIYSLLRNLRIDTRIFDDWGGVSSLLHCNFLFDDAPKKIIKTK